MLLLTLLHLLIVSDSPGGVPLIRNIPPGEYRAGSQNWASAQDGKGIMYFANNQGVLIYDGAHWQIVAMPNHSNVRALAVDPSGRVYVGAGHEFGYLEADRHARPTYRSLSQRLPETETFTNIWDIHLTSHGVYFRAADKTFRYHEETLTVLPVRGSKRGCVFHDRVVFSHGKDGLWLIDAGGPRLLPHSKPSVPAWSGSVVMPYSETELLLVHDGEPLVVDLSPHLGEGSPEAGLSFRALGGDVGAYLAKHRAYDGTSLGPGGFAVGTLGGGVVFFDGTGRIDRYVDRDHGLYRDRVYDVFCDRQNNVWLALNSGLALIDRNLPITRYVAVAPEDMMCLRRFKGLLYGGANNGLFVLNPSGRFERLPLEEDSLWDMIVFQDHLFVVGKALHHIQGKRVRTLSPPLPAGAIYCMGSSPRFPNTLFLGTRRGLLMVELRREGARFEVTGLRYLGGIDNRIRKIEADTSGNLWLSTRYQGLIYLAFEGESPENHKLFRYKTEQGLPRLDLCRTSFVQGELMVATPKGIFRVRGREPADWRFEPAPQFDAFDGDIRVSNLYWDGVDSLWVDSELGPGRFFMSDQGPPKWNQGPLKRLKNGSLYLDVDRSLWVYGDDDIYHYDPLVAGAEPPQFQTVIARVVVNGDFLIHGGFGTSAHAKPPQIPKEIHQQGGSLAFSYSATSYEADAAVSYSYMLEGFDKEWSAWSHRDQTLYTNLPGGRYRFKVKGRNIYGREGLPAGYGFIIPTPFYRTPLAIALYVALMLGVIVPVVLLDRSGLERRHRRETRRTLKKQEKQKFEALGRLAGGVAHDFNGILSSIYGFSSLLQREAPEKLSEPLAEIEKATERGRELVAQILTFARPDEGRRGPLDLHDELGQALNLIEVSLPENAVLERVIQRDVGLVWGNATHVHQVLFNLVQNAAQALSEDGGTITVGLTRDEGRTDKPVHMWVADTGKGMDAATRAQMFEPFFTTRERGRGTGLGLSVVHGILKSMKACRRVTSRVGAGTTIKLWFPEVVPKKSAEKPTEKPPEPAMRSGSLLWIDDDQNTLKRGVVFLRRRGYQAVGALLDEAPLAEWQRGAPAPDLIILGCERDWRAANLLADEVRASDEVMPLVTCYAEPEHAPRDVPQLSRPLDLEGLDRLICTLVPQAR